MAKEVKEKELPESIILEDENRKYRTVWMAVLGNAQQAYEELLNDRDVGELLPDFEKLDSVWIQNFVAEKINLVMQSPSTYNARVEASNEWKKLEKDWMKKVENIERLRNIDPEAKIEVKGCHITISNMDELLSEKTKYKTPEWYKVYYAKIIEAADKVLTLNAFQKEHGVKNPIQLIGILSFAGRPTDFIQSLIFDENLRKFIEDKKIPSHFDAAFKEHEEEVKRLEAERKKRFEEARAEKIRNGEQVDFGTSIRTIDGNLIPVGKS